MEKTIQIAKIHHDVLYFLTKRETSPPSTHYQKITVRNHKCKSPTSQGQTIDNPPNLELLNQIQAYHQYNKLCNQI